MRIYSQLIALAHIFIVVACNLKERMEEKINTLQDVKNNNGKEVVISGIYKKAFLNKNENNKEFYGNYQIMVNDTLSVILEAPYAPQAKRPEEEVKKYEGKRVKVEGILSDKTYMERPTLENQPLSVSIPCITEIKKIELD